MKYFFLGLASLLGLFQLIVFFQNLAVGEEATLALLADAWDMNPGMIMIFGFFLGAIATFTLILYFTGGKFPEPTENLSSGSSEEW